MEHFIAFYANNKQAFMYSAIAIVLPSTLLYWAEIWTILWHKPFHNSFYTLFCVRASTALANTVISNFYLRMPILFPEWFMSLELQYWAVSIFTFSRGYAFVSENLTMGFILANRFTAITRPTTHEHIWRKFMTPVLLIVYGLPLFNIGTFWVYVAVLAERDGQGRVVSVYFSEANNGTTLNTYVGTGAISSVIFLAFCIPINVAILWAYRKRRKQHKQPHVGQQQNQDNTIVQTNAAAKAKTDLIERRLLIFAVVTFFGHVSIALYLLALYLALATGNPTWASLLISQNTLMVDFGLVVLPAWLLLWASANFRKQLSATFLPNVLHNKLFGTTQITIVKPQTAAIGPAAKSMPILPIPKIEY